MRRLYLFLVRMHPRSFRLRFEEDLLLTLDDMSQRSRGYRIVWDVAASLPRQWILRPHDWLQEPVSPLRNEDMFCRFVVERRPHPMSLLLGWQKKWTRILQSSQTVLNCCEHGPQTTGSTAPTDCEKSKTRLPTSTVQSAWPRPMTGHGGRFSSPFQPKNPTS